MRPVYRAWLEATCWLAGVVLWFWFSYEFFPWWQPCLIWLGFVLLYGITKYRGCSPLALPFVALLALLGWMFLYRLDPSWARHHFWGLLLGFSAYLVGLFLPWAQKEYPWLYGGGSAALLLLTLTFGLRLKGAKAWLAVGPLRFQPVEFARVLLVLFFASSLTAQGEGKGKNWPAFLLLGAVFLILALQRDLGPALLIFLVFFSLFLYLSFSWTALLAFGAGGTAAAGAAWFIFPHLRTRIWAWLRPGDYLETKGYQILQGLFALQAGGAVGRGVGEGLGELIPAGHTDYLFAVIGEEMGLLGTFSLLLLYVALAFWGFLLLRDLPRGPLQTTGLGFLFLFHFQVFLVLGGLLRILPFTGMTLPFFSYGTSSLTAQFWMLGISTSLGRVRRWPPR